MLGLARCALQLHCIVDGNDGALHVASHRIAASMAMSLHCMLLRIALHVGALYRDIASLRIASSMATLALATWPNWGDGAQRAGCAYGIALTRTALGMAIDGPSRRVDAWGPIAMLLRVALDMPIGHFVQTPSCDMSTNMRTVASHVRRQG